MPGLWSVLYTGAINLQEGISNQLLVLCTFGLFMYVTLLHVWQLSKLLVLYSLCYIYLIWKLICIDFFDTRSVNRLFFRFNPRSANAYKINKHHMEKLNTRDLKHHNTWNHSPLVTFQHLTIAHRQAFKPPRPMFITSFIAIILGIFVVWLTIQCTITCFTTSTINNIVT